MSLKGQTPPTCDVRAVSVHPSISDIMLQRRERRNGPKRQTSYVCHLLGHGPGGVRSQCTRKPSHGLEALCRNRSSAALAKDLRPLDFRFNNGRDIREVGAGRLTAAPLLSAEQLSEYLGKERAKSNQRLEVKDEVAGSNHCPVPGWRYPGIGVAVERILVQRAIVGNFRANLDLR